MFKNVLLALVVVLICDVLFAQVVKRVMPTPRRIQMEMERSYRIPNAVYHHDLAPNRAERGAWGNRTYPIFTNSLGFKDRAVREVPLQSEPWRVLFIGDSFTEGTGVQYPDTFVGILDQVYAAQGIGVLNAAVVSYSPSIYYRKVKHLLEDVKLDFDELVVFIDISDIDDEGRCYDLDALDHVVTASTSPPVPTAETGWRATLKENSVLARLGDLAKDALLDRDAWHPVSSDQEALMHTLTDSDRSGWTVDPKRLEAYGRRGLARAQDRMDRLLALLRAHGKPLTVVVYPWPAQVLAGDRDSIQSRTWRAWCEKNGVAFVDLFPDFFASGAPMDVLHRYYIPWDNHFNEEGHAFVAQALQKQYAPSRDRTVNSP